MTKLTIIDNDTDFYELHDSQLASMSGGSFRLVGKRTTTIRVDRSLGLVADQRVMLQSKHPHLNGGPKTMTFITKKPTENGDGTVTWSLAQS